ncbi:MAG: GNAT family N-acetyltransferase [Phycisphaerae bacterium]|nr:GNAT family N-acetyltransferase [Phycisphaerae bacterium]
MLIRPLIPADAEAYTVLRREMLRDSPWAFAASEENDRGLDAEGLRQSLSGPGYAIVGAFDSAPSGSALVGAVGLYRSDHAKMAHRVGVWGAYVTPSQRGRGLGIQLLSAAADFARAWPGVDSLSLSVSVRAPAALNTYLRAGFVAWGTEPRAMAWNGEQIDEVHMVKRL